MKDIRISVRNKIALNRENDTYVCGNTDYKVVFDSENKRSFCIGMDDGGLYITMEGV